MVERDFYQLVIDSLEDYAVFTTDKTGVINSWNHGASNVLGYAHDEIIGQNSALFFTAEDFKASAHKKELKTALKDGRAVDERFHVRKDKTLFWSSGKVFPLFDADGKHMGFTKIMRNLDARKQAQEDLNEARKYAESIIDTAREPIIVLNEDLTINTANQSFYKLFKLKHKIFEAPIFEIGRGMFNIPQLAGLLEELKTTDTGIFNYEVIHEWPLVGKKYFLVNARKLRHPTTKRQLILFTIDDITQQRTLEQQKDDFISIASHEIRTPVTVIKAYAQMLHKRSSLVNDHMIGNSAIKINEKAEKLMLLVAYLLDVSQLETGEMIIKKDFFNLGDLVKESVDELALIDSHQFIIKGKSATPVFADRFRISQVINNLLNNACKYSSKQSAIVIKIGKKGENIIVSVQDHGLGIPKEEQANLFKRFWRASPAQEHNISGMGLGLHISSEIIKRHKGKIGFKSEINKGSQFYFSIPVENIEPADFNNSY